MLRFRSFSWQCAVFCLSYILFLAPAWGLAAQPTLEGTVTDPLGAAVYNARVDLLTVKGSVYVGRAFTDGRGHYVITTEKPGRYMARVVAPGFNVTFSRNVYLSAASPAYADVALQFGRLAQQVTVTANGTPTPQTQTGASTTDRKSVV